MPLLDPVTMGSSGSGPKQKASGSQSTSSIGALAPIPVDPSPQAQAVRHALPAVVISAYALSFSYIVADPVPAMTQLLIPIALLQIGATLVAVPPAGSATAKAKAKKAKPGEKRKDGGGPSIAIVCPTTMRPRLLRGFGS
jgi:hypothetical protein